MYKPQVVSAIIKLLCFSAEVDPGNQKFISSDVSDSSNLIMNL